MYWLFYYSISIFFNPSDMKQSFGRAALFFAILYCCMYVFYFKHGYCSLLSTFPSNLLLLCQHFALCFCVSIFLKIMHLQIGSSLSTVGHTKCVSYYRHKKQGEVSDFGHNCMQSVKWYCNKSSFCKKRANILLYIR